MLKKDNFYNFDLIFDKRFYIFGEYTFGISCYDKNDILLGELENTEHVYYFFNCFKEYNEKIFKSLKNIKEISQDNV